MADVIHRELTGLEKHTDIIWEPADEAARLAITVIDDHLGGIAWQQDNNTFWRAVANDPTVVWQSAGASEGNVTGPESSTDNTLCRFDGTTGELLQGSAITVDDSGNITAVGTVDGRNVADDGTAQDTHIAAANPHSGSAPTDHTHSWVLSDLSADLSWSGVTVTETVDSNSVGFGAVLRPDASGDLVLATSATTTHPGIFLALEEGTGSRTVLEWGVGRVRNDAWSWTPNQAIYLSSTPGVLSQVVSGTPVGFARSATVAYFGPVHDSFSDTTTAEITITHTGQTFQPRATLDTTTYPAATILWTYSDATTSSDALPTEKDFGTAATRQTTCEVTPAAALTSLNVGYLYGLDGAVWPDTNDLAAQSVTAITGLQSAPGLEVLAAVNAPATPNPNAMTTVDLTGLSALNTGEFYGNDLTSVGSIPASVTRLCLELNAMTSIDLTACSPVIEDFRGASQAGAGLSTVTWAAEGAPNLWHWCTHSNALTTIPDLTAATFPALVDIFLENNSIAGAVVMTCGSVATARFYNNQITSFNAEAGFRADNASSLDINNNPLTALDVSSNPRFGVLDCSSGSLNEAAVDAVLAQLVANNNSGYGALTADLTDNTAPSATGEAAKTTLEGLGWTVSTDSASTALWSDDFNRADGPVGNNWASLGSAIGAISSNQLQRTDNAGYQVLYNPAGGSLPADTVFTITVPHATRLQSYWGVGVRITASGAIVGAKFLWDGSAWRCGDANSAASTPGTADLVETGGAPPTWDTNQDHTVSVRSVDARHYLTVDGVEWGYSDYDINDQTGTGIATVGIGNNNLWDNAIVEAV